MSRLSRFLGLVPLLGLAELGLHQYFAERAPEWAEPLVRQVAPAAFPLAELARPDDSGFADFVEVSLLGQSAPELAGFAVQQTEQVGPFRVSLRKNPKPDRASFDFVSAVETGEVEVFTEVDEQLSPC